MLFDTPLLDVAANAPVASTSSAPPGAGSSAKKRRRSSSNHADAATGASSGTAPAAVAGEINLDKLLRKMKDAEGGAGGKAAGGAAAPKRAKEGKAGKKAKADEAVAPAPAPQKKEAAPAPAPDSAREPKRSKKERKAAKAGSPAVPRAQEQPASPAPAPYVRAAAQIAPPTRHAAPSQVVTASTSTGSTKAGSVQDKLRAQLAGGKFRMLNETLYTTSGDEAYSLMQEDGAFDDYHIGFRSQAATWPVHPLALIAQSLLASLAPNSLIADFGCGDAALARVLCPSATAAPGLPQIPSLKVTAKQAKQKQLKVVSFDLVSQSSYVVQAECSSVPLPGGTAGGEIVDAVVCCLSLMGTDWIRMVREAKRVLKDGGVLKIAEVTSRFTNIDDFVKLVSALGFSLSHKDDSNTHFILFDFQKKAGAEGIEDAGKADERTRKAATLLNPCIYKRR